MREWPDIGFKSGLIVLYQQSDFVYTVFIFLKSKLFSKIIMVKILLRNNAPHTKFKPIGECVWYRRIVWYREKINIWSYIFYLLHSEPKIISFWLKNKFHFITTYSSHACIYFSYIKRGKYNMSQRLPKYHINRAVVNSRWSWHLPKASLL